MKKEYAIIQSQENIATEIYSMWMETTLAKEARPGQFLMIYPRNESTLLPRPISICEVSPDKTSLRIVYRVAGKGTSEFSWYEAGETVMVMGPVGNGYPIKEEKFKRAFLMGGGIGIPPLLELAKNLDCEKDIIVGYRDELFLNNELSHYGDLYLATEDGSAGVKGNVLDAVKEHNLKADVIYACGPMPMLRAIKAYAEKEGIPAYISLEERMACGVGACLGCVCKTKEVHEHSQVKNARVCVDGPVFLAEDVDI